MKFTVRDMAKNAIGLILCMSFSFVALADEAEFKEKNFKMADAERKALKMKEDLKEIVSRSEAIKDPEEKKKVFKEAVQLHKQYRKKVRMLNKMKHELKYKYPREGKQSENKYTPMREEALEEIVSIQEDSSLNDFKKVVGNTYGRFVDSKSDKKTNYVAPKKRDQKQKKPRIKLEK